MPYIKYLELILESLIQTPNWICYTNFNISQETHQYRHETTLNKAIKNLCDGDAFITAKLRGKNYLSTIQERALYRQFIIKRLIGIEKLNGN